MPVDVHPSIILLLSLGRQHSGTVQNTAVSCCLPRDIGRGSGDDASRPGRQKSSYHGGRNQTDGMPFAGVVYRRCRGKYMDEKRPSHMHASSVRACQPSPPVGADDDDETSVSRCHKRKTSSSGARVRNRVSLRGHRLNFNGGRDLGTPLLKGTMPIDYSKWAALDCSDSDEESAPKVHIHCAAAILTSPTAQHASISISNNNLAVCSPQPRNRSLLLLSSSPRRKTPRGVIGMRQTIIGR